MKHIIIPKKSWNNFKNVKFVRKKNAAAPAHPGKKAFEKMIPLGAQFHGFHGINKNQQNPRKKRYFEKVAPEP